jgi:hypothetical protein
MFIGYCLLTKKENNVINQLQIILSQTKKDPSFSCKNNGFDCYLLGI